MTEGIRMINNAMEKICEAAVKAIDLSSLKSKAIEKKTIDEIIANEKELFEARLQEDLEAHEADRGS